MKRTMKTSDDLKSFCCWNAFDSISMGQLEKGYLTEYHSTNAIFFFLNDTLVLKLNIEIC